MAAEISEASRYKISGQLWWNSFFSWRRWKLYWQFVKVIFIENLSLKHVYTVDETALFCSVFFKKKKLTMIDEQARGFKDSKHRLKVLGCANAADR